MEKTFTSAADLRTAAKAAGIKESRLDKAVETYNLPEEGEFTEVQLVEGEFPHIRLVTNSGNKISLSGLQAMAQTWPLDRVVIETDAPYLPPHPHRGQRNEPAYVRLVAEKLAELYGRPLDTVAHATTSAAERLFWAGTINQ